MATFVADLVQAGLRYVCISPGSRSTPLTLAFAAQSEITCLPIIDERASAFVALGIAKATGIPAAIVCTSGTAVANLTPAVVESYYAGVPLLVLTADRPPEAHVRGSSQTIDQQHFFGHSVKQYIDAGTPGDALDLSQWYQHVAQYEFTLSTEGKPGPVHINFPFREPLAVRPLAPDATRRPSPTVYRATRRAPDAETLQTLADIVGSHDRGLIVGGWQCARTAVDQDDLKRAAVRFSAVTGWPIVDEFTSGLRFGHPVSGDVISTASLFCSHEPTAASLRPSAIVRFGGWPISKPLAALLESATDCAHIYIDDQDWHDPGGNATHIVRADPAATLDHLAELREPLRTTKTVGGEWAKAWHQAESATQMAVEAAWEESETLDEPQACQLAAGAVPEGGNLFVAASMSLRDVDSFVWAGGRNIRAFANRGANGIDGIMASAIGACVGSGRQPTVVILGDVAFAHDATSLAIASSNGLPISFVVLNNNGGSIFSFLPQAQLDLGEQFTNLFTTPPNINIGAAANMAGCSYSLITTAPELMGALAPLSSSLGAGPRVIEVTSSIRNNVDRHVELKMRVHAALDTLQRT